MLGKDAKWKWLGATLLLAMGLGTTPIGAATGGGDEPIVVSMGSKPSPESAFRSSARFRVAPLKRGVRPSTLMLTEFLPPIITQGKQNSCVGFTAAYYCYTYGVNRNRQLDPAAVADAKHQFSPAFVYNLSNGGKDEGITIHQGYRMIKELGCARMAEMPYDPLDWKKQPDDETKQRAKELRARDIAYLVRDASSSNPDIIKTFLFENKQPLTIGLPIFADFPLKAITDSEFVYDHSNEPEMQKILGHHALTVVGYNEEKKAFRAVNSWGTKWGDKGFLWISEEFVKKHVKEAWGILAPGGRSLPTMRGIIRVSPNVTLEQPQRP